MMKKSPLTKFLMGSAKTAAKPITFAIAISILVLWVVVGCIFGFSEGWLLIINTVATINASLMVLIIQNTQNRESKALHLKIDELIRVTKEAEQEVIAIEQAEEEELEAIRKKIFKDKVR